MRPGEGGKLRSSKIFFAWNIKCQSVTKFYLMDFSIEKCRREMFRSFGSIRDWINVASIGEMFVSRWASLIFVFQRSVWFLQSKSCQG